jgi:hypothetical protein
MLEDVVVELEVWVLEVVEEFVEDVVEDEVEDGVELLDLVVEVEVEPLELRTMPTPPAIAMMTMTATAAAILPIPLREVLTINHKNKRGSIFKTYLGGPTRLRGLLRPGFPLSLR